MIKVYKNKEKEIMKKSTFTKNAWYYWFDSLIIYITESTKGP